MLFLHMCYAVTFAGSLYSVWGYRSAQEFPIRIYISVEDCRPMAMLDTEPCEVSGSQSRETPDRVLT